MNRSNLPRIRIAAGTLVGALVFGACTQAAPTVAPPSKPALAPISVGTSPVTRELLRPTLSYTGNVQAKNVVNLVPKISSRLDALNYEVGDEVRAGDVVAELDRTQLDAQVLQAEAALHGAEAKLEQTQSSAPEAEIDAAQAVVDQAYARLRDAQDGGRPEEVAAARAAATQAQARAEQVSAGARGEDRTALQAVVDQGQAQQDQIRAQLTAAQTTLAESRFRLDQARSGQGGPGVRPEDISQAEATLVTNRAKLDQVRNPRVEDLRIAQADVDKARSDLEAAIENRENCGKATTTTRNESTQKTSAGTTKSDSKSTSRQSCSDTQKTSLDAVVEAARATLRSKEASLEKIKNPDPRDIAAADANVRTAEANLQKLRFGGTSDVASLEVKLAQSQSEVDRLQGNLDQAAANVTNAQAKLDAAVNPDPNDVSQAAAAANQARANLAKTANPDPAQVQIAQGSLDQAQAQYNQKLRPFTEQDIRVAAASVEQSAAALTVARVNAAEAIIRAPFDGTISQKLLNPGALASPSTPIVGLVSREVETFVQVEEARLGQIQRDQPATLTVSAYPGKVFDARVASIAPAADTKSRTFAVRIVPLAQDGTLRDGMFAQVNIVGAGQVQLLIPNDGIVTRSGRTQAFVAANDRASARDLRLGESDGKRTAVLEGRVNAGDEVVVTNPQALTDGAPIVVEQRNVPPSGKPATPTNGQNGSAPSSPRGDVPAGGAEGRSREQTPAGESGR